MITPNDIDNLITAAGLAEIDVDPNALTLLTWESGPNHIPEPIPNGYNAVYVFFHGNVCLKVGKTSGQNANPRYQSQHYYTKAPSTLAKSLLSDPNYSVMIGDQRPKDWMLANTTRYNILISARYSVHFVGFVESFFILKLNPRFEG